MLFISHSSKDNAAATRLAAWLHAQGFDDIFLDIDARRGLLPGQRWQEELKRAGERCQAVFVLVSPDWAASRWCVTEFLLADQLGKRIFPVLVAPTDYKELPQELVAHFHIADISSPDKETDGFARLSAGLRQAGLDASHFPWPPADEPKRPAYRGLQALEEADAGIFFGRDGAIVRGLDALRRIRDGAPERLVAILGASGAGKSSFLRAGLLARLQRDAGNFFCLPALRPERAALSGPRGLRQVLFAASGKRDLKAVDAALCEGVVGIAAFVTGLARAAASPGPPLPTIILPIDQAEELFSNDQTEGPALLDLLAALLAPDTGIVAVLTIRSDSFERLQNERRLDAIPRLPFDLPPLPATAFKEVIESPARLMHPPLKVEPALTELLLEELGGADSLPLLAFALARLVEIGGGDGVLDVADYTDAVGGLAGAIEGAVDAAFIAALSDPVLPNTRAALEALARAAFLPWLVQADPAGAAAKRAIARLDNLPEAARPLIGHFVDQRLLVSDRRDGVATVEVAHESILRHWPRLSQWIAEETDRLRALDAATRAAGDWAARKPGQAAGAWLAHHGPRLADAEAMAAQPAYAAKLGATGLAYLRACRSAARRASRVRRSLLGALVAACLAVAIGSLAYAFQFELTLAWTKWAHTELIASSDLRPRQAFDECSAPVICPEMTVLPAGHFLMGSPDDETGHQSNESPRHEVTFVRPFAVGRYEISFAEWNQCVALTDQAALTRAQTAGQPRIGCAPVSTQGFDKRLKSGDPARMPAINIGWDDAKGYIAWLNSFLTGAPEGPYRLLTEAEWEYAARAGSQDEYPWGVNEADACTYANVFTAAAQARYPENKADVPDCGDDFMETAPAGSFQANGFTLFDMEGNVWEWLEDCEGAAYDTAPADGTAVAQENCRRRSLRGGAWNFDVAYTRSASRGGSGIESRVNYIGFRIARTLAPP